MTDAKAPRVCLLIGQLGLGGTEKQLTLLAAGLRARGLRVSVLAMFDGGPYEGVLRAAGVPVLRLGFRRRAAGWWRMPYGNAVAFRRLVRLLRRGRPDVLHAFLFHGYTTAAPAARLAGVPVVVAARRSLGRFKRGRSLAQAAEAVATLLTDHVAANSAAVARDAAREPGTRRGMISVIPNGLTADAFARVPAARIDTPLPVVLCVANLIGYKGHRHLLDAMAVLRDRGTPGTLLLAGDGPERAALRDQAARLAVDVRLLGARRDVPALLARADVVALASVEEGMSNAVMEAMAAGRPIVATAVGGTPELLGGDGRRGILVPPGDPRALADGIGRVLGDPAAAARMAARARRWSRAHLSADAMVERHVELYTRLLADARGRRRCAG